MFSNGTSFVDHLRRQPLISACFVAMTVTAVAGLVWACPVCPGQVAFGFHKKVFWVVGVVLPAVLLACTAFSKTDLTTFRRLAGGGACSGTLSDGLALHAPGSYGDLPVLPNVVGTLFGRARRKLVAPP